MNQTWLQGHGEMQGTLYLLVVLAYFWPTTSPSHVSLPITLPNKYGEQSIRLGFLQHLLRAEDAVCPYYQYLGVYFL
jgi:hypothetical protein